MDLTKNTHHYSSLDGDRREIRLLKLFPGARDDPIRCTLVTHSLDDKPEYYALSYMWGTDISATICVDHNDFFRVTENLSRALRDFRLPDAPLTLWADAICIDQSNIPERGSQVNLMKDIYSGAQEVRAWLDFDLAADNPVVERLHGLSPTTEDSFRDLGEEPEVWEPMERLFKNQYWDRLWIQQELVCSGKFAIYCRATRLEGESMMRFQERLAQQSGKHNQTVEGQTSWSKLHEAVKVGHVPSRHIRWWRVMKSTGRMVHITRLQTPPEILAPANVKLKKRYSEAAIITPNYLLGGLRIAARLHATDPRDRIYSTLNIVSDCAPGDIDVDYGKSVGEVYTDTARCIMRKYQNLHFLPYAWMPLDLENDKVLEQGKDDVPDIPSWVPQWHRVDRSVFWIPFSASGDVIARPDIGTRTGNRLPVRGFRIDRVRHVPAQSCFYFQPLRIFVDMILPFLVGLEGETLGRAIRRTVTLLTDALVSLPIIETTRQDHMPSANERFLYMTLLLRAGAVLSDYLIVNLLGSEVESAARMTEFLAASQALEAQDQTPIRHVDIADLVRNEGFCKPDHEAFNVMLRCIVNTLAGCVLVGLEDPQRCFGTLNLCAVEEGDEVWLLFGCATPMVLRRKGDDEEGRGEYEVVSAAWIPGVMDGELVLGMEGEFYDGQKLWGREVETIHLV